MNFILNIVKIYMIALILERFIMKPSNSFDIYFGVPGSGKTTFAAWLAKKRLKKKGKVFSNVSIKGAYKVDRKDIGAYDISNALLIFDEVGVEYNNRDFSKFTDRELYFFKFHRHYHVDVALFSQDWEDMDKKLQKLATRLFYIRKSIIPFCFSRRLIFKTIGIDKETHQIVENYKFSWLHRRIIFAPVVWKMFNSHDRKEFPKKDFPVWGSAGCSARTGEPTACEKCKNVLTDLNKFDLFFLGKYLYFLKKIISQKNERKKMLTN